MDRRALEKRYDELRYEVDTLRLRCRDLEQEAHVSGPELYRAYQRIDRLEQQRDRLAAENKVLKQKLSEVTAKLKSKPAPVVRSLVKPNVTDKTPKRPGRKHGHAAALRPMPAKIDVHETVALPIDTLGEPCCPECRTQLSEVEHHKRAAYGVKQLALVQRVANQLATTLHIYELRRPLLDARFARA